MGGIRGVSKERGSYSSDWCEESYTIERTNVQQKEPENQETMQTTG